VAAALATTPQALMERALRIVKAVGDDVDVTAVPSTAAVGGGGAPGVELPSAAVALPATLAGPLRLAGTPVVGRVEGGRLLLDLVAVLPGDDATVVAAVRSVLGLPEPSPADASTGA
jgi:L-seryl-tRNA(Ser) seleniumtransferase